MPYFAVENSLTIDDGTASDSSPQAYTLQEQLQVETQPPPYFQVDREHYCPDWVSSEDETLPVPVDDLNLNSL